MSAPTTTTKEAPATSSVASSVKFKTFVTTFSLVGPLAYMICLFFNWPLFSFHPATNRFAWGWEGARSGEGPVMHWYGWTLNAIIAGAVLGYLATLLPEKVTKKIPLNLLWVIPILAIPYLAWDLRQWWFK